MPTNDLIGPALQARLERLLGARIEGCATVYGGYSAARRLLCRTASGRLFAKVATDPFTCRALRREIQVYGAISAPFLPRVIGWDDDGATPLLLLEDLSAARWPPPWDSAAVEAVLDRIREMHGTVASLPSYAEAHGAFEPSWPKVAATPQPFLALGLADAAWLDRALPLLVEQEARCTLSGERFVHLDLRSDNMCLSRRGAVFVDWSFACLADPAVDLGFWLPSLAAEGGPAPERILPDAPEVAALVSGYFAARAGQPAVGNAPRVRAVQRRQLAIALPWAARALGLPPPTDALLT